MEASTLPFSTFRWKLLFFWHTIALILLLSLLTPVWMGLDTHIFRFLNTPLEHSHELRLFWAAANHRLADWFEDLCILAFFLAAVFRAPKEMKRKRVAQMIFCTLFIAGTILLINRVLCRDLIRCRRDSPTLLLEHPVLLSDYIKSFTVKVVSTKSFPGDHATTALLFSAIYAYLVRGKLAIAAIAYGILLCLPRLVVGAHWPSDVIVGSGAILMVALSWAFCTPLAEKLTQKIEKILPQFTKI